MNNLRLIPVILIALFLASCSNSDDSDNNGPIAGIYFPSNNTNIWTYDVDNTSTTNPELNFTNESDLLKVDTSTGNSFTLEVNNGALANGVMDDILSAGILTISESTLNYSGDLQLPDEFSGFSNQNISLQNVLLYDLNAANNSIMSQVSNSITEDLILNEESVPLTIDYTLTTSKISLLNNLSVNGQSYSNVIGSKLVLTLNIYATIPVFGNMAIIDNQDVIVINNYFAEDIGLIKSEAVQSYEMDSDFLALLETTSTELGIATSLNVSNVMELDDFF